MSSPRRGTCSCNTESLWVPGSLAVGLLVGLLISSGKEEFLQRASAVVGWSYFCAWSISFYPQIFLTFARKSVVGLSLEFPVLNVLGFACYFLFNVLLFCDGYVQDEYKDAYGGRSAVRLNDVFFAGHALAVTLFLLLLFAMYYDHPRLEGADRLLRVATLLAFSSAVTLLLGLALVVWWQRESFCSWLQYLRLLSAVKLVVTFVKYCPQIYLNCKRKSNVGWNVNQFKLDLLGGILSVLQQLLDCYAARSWSQLTGDPVKLLLGLVAMLFDLVFLTQHCAYAERKAEPLLTVDSRLDDAARGEEGGLC